MAKDLYVTTVVKKSQNGKPYVQSFIDKGGAAKTAAKPAAKPTKEKAAVPCPVCGRPKEYPSKPVCLACYRAGVKSKAGAAKHNRTTHKEKTSAVRPLLHAG